MWRSRTKTREIKGADLIELDILFLEPTAEGPVIQRANRRALKGGVIADKLFALVKKRRRYVKIPMGLSSAQPL